MRGATLAILEVLGQHKPPRQRWAKTGRKQWQLDQLGTSPDAELAARLGQDHYGVRVMRNRLGKRQPA
jgi:hypothetical protein